MLTSVPTAINAASRQVVLRHPNAFDCIVSRKRTLREEADPNTGSPSEMGGSPTMGGMGVLRSEDEDQIEYQELGPGRLMFAAPFQASDMIERDNGLVPELQREVLIESVAAPGLPGHFLADSGDLVVITLAPGVLMAYEVATVAGNVHIPPYTRRLVLNPRDDLAYVAPFTP